MPRRRTVALLFTLTASPYAMADGDNSCDLKLDPDKIKLGESTDLYFVAHGVVDSASMEDGYGLNIPFDVLTFTPRERGHFRLKAGVTGMHSSSDCYANYVVE